MSNPNSIVVASSSSKVDQIEVVCRLCKRQFAKYTCPSCNVPYCSLTCFRSSEHSACSEGFYKKEIQENINSEPSKSAEERQKMMELLQKFEDESQAQDLFNSDDEDDESDLTSRFASIDIGSTSSEVLWSLLSPEERNRFLKAFQNPSSDLAQRLLSSDVLKSEIQPPWWKRHVIDAEESDHPRMPHFMPIPSSLVQPAHTSKPLLAFNIVALCISYAYINRHLGTSPLCDLKPEDPEHREAQRLFSRMVPFLTDRKSTLLYPNLTAVITDSWAGFELGTMSNEIFSLLLGDTVQLLSPLRVIETRSHISDPSADVECSSHPHSNTVRMLSDIYHLFKMDRNEKDMGPSRGTNEDQLKRPNHVAQKLVFYGGYILSTPSAVLNGLVTDIRMVSRRYEADAIGGTDQEIPRME